MIAALLATYGFLMMLAAPLVYRATRLLGKPQWPWWFFVSAIFGVSLDRLRTAWGIHQGTIPEPMDTVQAALYVGVGIAVCSAAAGLQTFLQAWYDDRERRFQRSVWSSLTEVYLLDPVTLHVVDYNRGAEGRLPTAEPIGTFSSFFTSPFNDFKSAIAPLLDRSERSVVVEADLSTPDGDARPVRITAQWVEEEGEELLVAFVADSSDYRRAEEEARAQEERFRLIAESVGDGIVITDLEGIILYENPKAGPMLGFGPQVRLGQGALDQASEEDREWLVGEVTKVASGEQDSFEGTARFRRADTNEPVVIEFLARRVELPGRGTCLLVSHRDVTERVESEMRRRRLEERLRRRQSTLASLSRTNSLREGDVEAFGVAVAKALTRELPVARGSVWILKDEGQKLECLALHEALANEITAGVVLDAREYPSYFAALDEGRVIDAIDAHQDPRTAEFSEGYLTPLGIGAMLDGVVRVGGAGGVICAEHVGGARRWTAEEASFVAELADLVAVAVQERRRRDAEAERRQFADQLRVSQRMETLGVMAGGIAHDFNNLLTPILGYAEMVLEDLPGDEREESPMAEIRSAGERAQALVRQLLTFSRQVEQDRTAVDLRDLLREVLRLVRASLPSTIEIGTELEPDVGVVEGDGSQLHQVFMNLCTNSGYSMREEGGRLDITLESVDVQPDDPSSPLGLAPGQYARVVVEDTGTGMDEETLQRVFEPFFTTKPAGEGTGLGMAVTHGIILGHRGSIDVESEPGGGTRISVLLPVSDGRVEEVVQGFDTEPERASGQRVLVVDDEVAVGRFVARVLERAGYLVDRYASPIEAVGAVMNGEISPDLVVTDQTMPGLTGLAMIVQLRESHPELRAIVMSGYDAALDGPALSAAGVQHFIRKPFKGAELVRAVRGVTEASLAAD